MKLRLKTKISFSFMYVGQTQINLIFIVIEKLYINQHIILAGDFNVFEPKTRYKKLNNPQNQCELNKLIDILELEDGFRISHPERKR